MRIDGLSILDRELSVFRSLGITDITLVTGHFGNVLEKIPGVKTVRNEDFQNNNILFSLMYADRELDDDVVIAYSDIFFDRSVAERLLAATGDILVVADTDWRRIYVDRADNPSDQAEKAALRDGRVRKIGKHLPEAEGDAEFIGLFRLSREGCAVWKRVFADVVKNLDGKPFQAAPLLKKAYVSDFLQELIDRGQAVVPVLIQGGWREIDTVEDFRKAGGVMPPEDRA